MHVPDTWNFWTCTYIDLDIYTKPKTFQDYFDLDIYIGAPIYRWDFRMGLARLGQQYRRPR